MFLTGGCALASGLAPFRSRAAATELRVAYGENYPPYSKLDLEAVTGGMAVDVVDVVGRYSDIATVHWSAPWLRAQGAVRDGSADALLTIATEERRAYVTFTNVPAFIDPLVMFYRKDNIRRREIELLTTVSELGEFSISDYIGNGWAAERLSGIARDLAPSPSLAIQKVAAGRGDIVLASQTMGFWVLGKDARLSEMAWSPLDCLPSLEYRLGIRTTHQDCRSLIDRINRALSLAECRGEIDAVINKYSSICRLETN